MDEHEEVQQNNMISNLPLLFANGYPTSLDKITESQLENFIPFMVQCSLGHINLQGKIDYSEPEWWPEDLPFYIPFTKPKRFAGDWIKKMKDVVITCYQFHKSLFLLKFCNDLASYEHASLRFINNYNSTTSLFDRRSNKLLVTFRNENMSYDQPQRMRKCLLQQKSKNGCQIGQEQIMVEPAPFDIYLCDNCDAELYSKEAILEHEKTCNVDDDDDVILCDTPEPDEHVSSMGPDAPGNVIEHNEQRIGFLLNFNLQHRDRGDQHCATTTTTTTITQTSATNSSTTTNTTTTTATAPNSVSDKKYSTVTASAITTRTTSSGVLKSKEESGFMIIDRNKRMPRRNRAVHSLTRCPSIPLSSPAGQLLLRTTKTSISSEYLTERLDRIERFCQAPMLSKQSNKSKYLEKRHNASNPHCTFKQPQEYSAHVYTFPRRQFSQRRRRQNLFFLNSSLLRRCRPISVRLKKITEREMISKRHMASSSKLNIKLTRDTTQSSNWKISSASSATEIIVDTIDLCSSDDDDVDASSEHSSIKTKQHTRPLVVGQTSMAIATTTTGATTTTKLTTTTTTDAAATATITSAATSDGSAIIAARHSTSKVTASITSSRNVGTDDSTKNNIRSRSCLKKIGSEISIIPIRKSLNGSGQTVAGAATAGAGAVAAATGGASVGSTNQLRIESSGVRSSSLLKLFANATATKTMTDTQLLGVTNGGPTTGSGGGGGGGGVGSGSGKTTGLFEGNFRLSQNAAATALGNLNSSHTNAAQVKPLRSVYIVSNHVRNYPLSAIVSAAAGGVANTNSHTALDANSNGGNLFHGQENQRLSAASLSIRSSSYNAKRTANLTAVTSSSLSSSSAPSTTALAKAAANSTPSTTTTTDWYDSLDCDLDNSGSTRNLSLMQSFGSPSRGIISIDLTS